MENINNINIGINEQIITGRKYRRLIDKAAKLWQRISWWTKASDVEFDDGRTAEQKVGNINGITSNFENGSDDIAASSVLTKKIKDDLNEGIINEHIQLVIDENGKLGWKKDGADTVIPFNNFTILKVTTTPALSLYGTASMSWNIKDKYPNYENISLDNMLIQYNGRTHIASQADSNGREYINSALWDDPSWSYNSSTGKITGKYQTPSSSYAGQYLEFANHSSGSTTPISHTITVVIFENDTVANLLNK